MILPVILAVLLLCGAKRETVLNVDLFPYVPDVARFQQSIEAAWYEVHPEIALNFVSWDCYREDPTEDLDVFVYDAIYLHDFLEKGYLLPIPEESIRDMDDFFPGALSACQSDGITYALPQLLCTNLLYAWEGDTELRDVKTPPRRHPTARDRLPAAQGSRTAAAGPSSDTARTCITWAAKRRRWFFTGSLFPRGMIFP